MTIYEHKLKKRREGELDMAELKGKVLLIVNTATGCGFTPQYEGLEKLYETYHDKGLEVLDLPCNQFGSQAPGDDAEIHEFCTAKYKTQFDQLAKIEVNGENADPLYKWLVANSSFEGFGKRPAGLAMSGVLKLKDKDYKNNSNIKWNFTKFLIGKDGQLLGRFEPTIPMKKVREAVEKAL
jgi:glutathione peroxidase